jgi:hypothetical protein
MTDKTPEQCDAEAEAFIQMVKDKMPENMRAEHIINLCGSVLTSYGSEKEVVAWTAALVMALRGFYAEMDGDEEHCDCPKCAERRRAVAH